MGEMPGPPALRRRLLLLLVLLFAGSAGAAPLPQTGAGERARGGDWAAGTGLRGPLHEGEGTAGPGRPGRRGIGGPAQGGKPREVSD